MRRPAILAAILLSLSAPASAQDPRARLAASQAAGLFIASCLSHASDAPALRAWARKLELKTLPAKGTEGFLHGTPGVVFDASNPTGQFVVVSHDDGACAVIVRGVDQAALVPAAEAAFAQAGVVAILAAERADAEVAGARHRTYHAAGSGRSWTVVLSTTKGQALLSATAR